MTTVERVKALVDPLRKPGAHGVPAEWIDAFEKEFGATLPPELREWWTYCNGSYDLDEGILNGFQGEEESDFFDVSARLKLVPSWNELGWIPVAGDGCGNTYVMIPWSKGYVVGFVDAIKGTEEVQYLVASSLDAFVLFYIENELVLRNAWEIVDEDSWWPHDEAIMRVADPQLIERADDYVLPWDDDDLPWNRKDE